MALARAGLVAAIVVGLDQLTKHTLAAGIAPGRDEEVPAGDQPRPRAQHRGRVRRPVRRRGGGAGVHRGGAAGAGRVPAARPERPWLWLPTGMLVGGALGNLIDRIASGSVIDFIKLPAWPAFNVADMSITFGVIALVLVLEIGRKDGG